jgi:hypothetical protein
MPIPAAPLRRGDRGAAVADLHRTLEAINRVVDKTERAGRIFGGATEGLLREFQKQAALPVTGVFDADTHAAITHMLADIGPFTVFGQVTDADGQPIAGATVFAVDVDLRRTEVLGQAKTDTGGEYEVRYAASKFTRAEKASADLLVRALLGDQRLAESPVSFNAPAELRIDLASTEHHGASELERLETELAPLLDGVAVAELSDADVDFLAGETGFPAGTWRAYLRAQRLVTTVPEGIPFAACYGWQRTDQPATWDALRAVRIDVLRASLVDALDRNLIPRALREQLDAILARIPNAERNGLAVLLDAAALPFDVTHGLFGRVAAIDAVSDAVLAELIETKTVTRAVAERVGLAASLHRLVGGEPAAIAAVVGAEFPTLPDGKLRQARDLAALDPGDWARALKSAGAPVPEGVSLEEHARTRAIEATRAFPDAAFRHRAPRVPEHIGEHVERFHALLHTNKDALDRDFDELDLDGVSDHERAHLRTAHAEVRAMANAHPGLGLRDVLVEGGPEAAKIAATRIGWVSQVLARNPETKFLELDYLPDTPELTAIDFGDLSAEARALVLSDLRAHRRVNAVAGDAITTQQLMVAQLYSGAEIARTSTAELVARTGIAEAEIQAIQGTALSVANVAALAWFGIYDLTRDQATTPVRVIPSRQQFFYPLSGYAALINDQPWCECEQCQSVLSPAAYFVDLMHYVETNILAGSFATQPAHPLHLERRRPDLWELPLSCANTKDFIPYLDIVNEILERYIREVAPLPAATPVYAHLAEQEASFRQPFTLPIERLDTLLGHFELSRHAVARSMRAPRDVQARARLGLSPRAYALVTTERTDPVYLRRLFGIETTVTDADTALAAVEMATLVRATGLDHDVLAAALTSQFVGANGTPPPAIAIVVGKRYPNDVQNNTEVVNNLTFRRLDRLHRFLRLWRTLPWTVVELDYVLGRLAPANARPQIVADTAAAPGTLERITRILELEAAWSIPLEQVLAIADAFPTRALRAPTPLFDRLFNPPAFADRDGAWTAQTTGPFTHPAWSTIGAPGVASPDDNTLSRLLSGLQLADQEFVDLVAGLRTDPALAYQPGTQVASESISLSRASITSLYRHARVRSLLRVSVEDFVALLGLVPRGPGLPALGYLRDLDDVRTLVDFVAWREDSKLSVRELVYLTSGRTPPSGTPDPATLSRELPGAIAAIADPTARGAILAGAAPLALFDLGIGGQLGRSPDEIAFLRACIAPLTAADLAAVVRVMAGGTAAADVAGVVALVADVVRFHRLFPRPAFDRAGLDFVRRQRAVFFGAAPAAGAGEAVTADTIRKVAAYRALVTSTDAGFTTATATPDLVAIKKVVESAATATDAEVARALGTDEARVAALTPHLTLSGEPFADLALVAENLALAQTLGVSGETLARMIDESPAVTTFDQLSRAADDVLGAFRAKYPDAATLAEKLEPYEDILRGRKRDGLVDYLTTRWPTPFASADRLYDYFLVDVMMGGCARTSRVVAAMSSVQLYVHRVLMSLERSADWDGLVPPKVGVYARFSDDAKRGEWQWRQHYRVWEANRKVFLYPENYIEPELRDDKTPLFAELEDTLLMQDITPANAQDAYSAYLTGFDGLARLQIAGAYRDVAGKTLHLFGVSQDDAPVYYYRSIDESKVTAAHPAPLTSPWHKVNLQIPVRKVSPFLFEGRLYLFWVENATRPINSFFEGSSNFGGYRHTLRVRYSTLRLDGTWAAPQLVRFADKDGIADARIVEDPRDTKLVDGLEAQRQHLADVERPALDEEVRAKTTQRNQARDAIPPLTEARVARQDALYSALSLEQSIAQAALIAIGTPPHVAWWIVKAVQKAVWLDAVNKENNAREHLRNSEDVLANATTRLTNLDRRIAELVASIKKEVIHVRWDRSLRDHTEALDSYRPDGWAWDRVYADVYAPPRPDLPEGAPRPQAIRLTLVPDGNHLPTETPIGTGDFDPVSGVLRPPLVAEPSASRSADRLNWETGKIQKRYLSATSYPGQEAISDAYWLEARNVVGGHVATAPPVADLQIVMGQSSSLIVQHEGDAVWLRPVSSSYLGKRLGTSLTRSLARAFWSGGPPGLLDAEFQRSLVETRSRISPVAGQSDPARQSPFHPEHPWLAYYRETFFHIPFLIADHLNTEQDFAAAQRWYHTIFDPTAADGEAWRNRELREPENQTTTLRDLLIDGATLDAYRKDPFNPHVIARTRMSAYAKSIVMKYIDNLLDWGDSLFAQFTMESVNEATMLYVMARDILGPRPAMLGSCGTGVAARTYRTIRAGMNAVSDFLVELETPPAIRPWQRSGDGNVLVIPLLTAQPVAYAQAATAAPAAPGAPMAPRMRLVGAPGAPPPPPTGGLPFDGGDGVAYGGGVAQTPVTLTQLSAGHTVWTSTGGTPLSTLGGGATAGGGVTVGTGSPPVTVLPGGGFTDFVEGHGPGSVGIRNGNALTPFDELTDRYGVHQLDLKHGLGDGDVISRFDDPRDRDRLDRYQFDPVDVVPPKDTVFCIPPNKELLAYWDRVEDRLFKIRSCMDISGARRRLDLFAPEIDPRFLVRMTAAGLTVDDVLGMTGGQLPPYRFVYLIDKAKQHAGTVQSFGAQLLSALEKGDAEELNHLRTVHEQNLLKMRTKLSQLEIDAAEDALASLRLQREAVEYRRQHFVALRETGTLPEERKQQELQREASQFRIAAGIAQTVASILTIIPDFGAPTAMKFGGSQLGASGRAVGEGLGAQASFLDTGAAMAGIEASAKRRDEEWKHQEETARRELAQLDKNITAAEIRRDIAVHSLEVHERTVAQTEEMFAFFRERFATVDRYRLLAKDLRRLYRMAFDSALRLALMAEQAYRAEREDTDDDTLGRNHWDPQNAGLLAGEKLLADLQRLERQYIERNRRQLEIEHSFSLAQLAPDKLAELRLTGECSFKIPEWFFDLSYPGQYRRRIKTVRMSMPCVTGPYTNVGATLRMTGSRIRLDAPTSQTATLAEPVTVSLGHTVSIATSKAQLDAGVFEFSFRDERYMPFEGAGAISDWTLALPKTLRVFDYSTITDVIIHLNYTAEHHAELARRWDTAAALVALLSGDIDGKPPLVRRFSLRDERPDVFHRLVTSTPGTEVTLAIDARHFAVFLAGRELEARTASIAIVTPLEELAGASVALARKPIATATAAFVTRVAPDLPTGGIEDGLREFDCGSVFRTAPGGAGVGPELVGDYIIKVEAAGALASAAAASSIDPSAVHDIVLRVGYRLATDDN